MLSYRTRFIRRQTLWANHFHPVPIELWLPRAVRNFVWCLSIETSIATRIEFGIQHNTGSHDWFLFCETKLSLQRISLQKLSTRSTDSRARRQVLRIRTACCMSRKHITEPRRSSGKCNSGKTVLSSARSSPNSSLPGFKKWLMIQNEIAQIWSNSMRFLIIMSSSMFWQMKFLVSTLFERQDREIGRVPSCVGSPPLFGLWNAKKWHN